MNLKKNEDLVRYWLERDPSLRDDDRRLIANIWWEEAKELNLHTSKGEQFIRAFSLGKLSDPESITRVRRKLQENNVALRGKKYNERHKNTRNIIEELRLIV